MMEYYRIVVDAWRMFKQYLPEAEKENNESYFTKVLAAADGITKGHQKNKAFCLALLMVFVEELRRIAEEEKVK